MSEGLAGLFPGQLSEKPGMGERLFESHSYVREWFDEVRERTGVDLPATFFGEGSERLHDDLPAQVGVFAVSVAATDALDRELSCRPTAVAGYSLGTYAAFVAAGVLDRVTALGLVVEAARLLEELSPPGAMGYTIGLQRPALEAIIEETSSTGLAGIGNENAAQQLIVTGEPAAVARVLDAARKSALRAEMLPLRFPMHSPLLGPVSARLRDHVAQLEVREPTDVALFAPMSGQVVRTAVEARSVLSDQLATPSRWSAVLRAMGEAGYADFLEIGPGDILTKLLRWTLRKGRCRVVEDPESVLLVARVGSGEESSAVPSPGARRAEESS